MRCFCSLQVTLLVESGSLSQAQLVHLALSFKEPALQVLSEPGAAAEQPLLPVALAGSVAAGRLGGVVSCATSACVCC
jgi:hypothetical protein